MFKKTLPINKQVAFKRSDGSLCFGMILSKNIDGSVEVGWEEDGLPLGKRLEVSEIVQVPMRRSIFAWVKIVLLVVVLVAFSYLSLSYYLDANKMNQECEKLNKGRFFPINCIQKLNILEAFVHVLFSAFGKSFNSFYLSLVNGLGFVDFFTMLFFMVFFLCLLFFFFFLMLNKIWTK